MSAVRRSRDDLKGYLLLEQEAAAFLNVSVPTLRRWRWSGGGPLFLKVGRCVRYDPKDVKAFVDQSRRRSTTERRPNSQGPLGQKSPGAKT